MGQRRHRHPWPGRGPRTRAGGWDPPGGLRRCRGAFAPLPRGIAAMAGRESPAGSCRPSPRDGVEAGGRAATELAARHRDGDGAFTPRGPPAWPWGQELGSGPGSGGSPPGGSPASSRGLSWGSPGAELGASLGWPESGWGRGTGLGKEPRGWCGKRSRAKAPRAPGKASGGPAPENGAANEHRGGGPGRPRGGRCRL